MRVEPDLIDWRKDGIKYARSQVNESVGDEESSSDRRLPWVAIVLGEGVKGQKWNHSS